MMNLRDDFPILSEKVHGKPWFILTMRQQVKNHCVLLKGLNNIMNHIIPMFIGEYMI